jgi:transposase-like protein
VRHPAPASSTKAARHPAPPRRPRVPAPDEKAAALRMFAAGTAAPAAAKALGVSRATAYRWWGEHRAGQAAQADPSPSGAVPVPAGLDAEQEWTTRLAMAAAHRR